MLSQIFHSFHPEVFGEFVRGYPYIILLMVVGFVLHFIPSRMQDFAQNQVVRSPFALKLAYLLLIIFVVIQIKSSEIQPFIYFQF